MRPDQTYATHHPEALVLAVSLELAAASWKVALPNSVSIWLRVSFLRITLAARRILRVQSATMLPKVDSDWRGSVNDDLPK